MDGETFNLGLGVGGKSYTEKVIFKLRPLFSEEIMETEPSRCKSEWPENSPKFKPRWCPPHFFTSNRSKKRQKKPTPVPRPGVLLLQSERSENNTGREV